MADFGSQFSFNAGGSDPQAFLSRLSAYAAQLAQSQFAWGQQQYANTSALTDQVVNNYLSTASRATQMGIDDLARYRSIFQPQENQLVTDANTYASQERVKSEMGRAEAGVAQGMDAQRQNSIRDLQSYGIDPSAGRFSALDKAERAQQGAAEAGAGNTARLATEATGRALRSEAIQVGQRYPGQVINAMNTGLQSLAGAENSKLANASLGKSLLGGPQDWAAIAAGMKYPPNYGAAGGSVAKGAANPQTGGGGKSGGGGGSPGGGSGGSLSSNAQPGYQGSGSSNRSAPNSSAYGVDPSASGSNPDWWQTTLDPGIYQNPSWGISGEGDFGSSNYYTDTPTAYTGDWGGTSGAGGSSAGDYSSWPSDGGYSGDYGGGADYSSMYGGDYGGGGGGDYSGDWSGGGSGAAYAEGGEVGAIPTTGGAVPQMASPSAGKQTDDVAARLNAGEFVIPKDVAAWKGQEFFQNLIKKSRENKVGAPAKATSKPALNRAPSFSSQAIPVG